ncbi:MAG: hypothetical protein ACRD26_01195 [Vicinamibacterales bacterium]
MSTRRVRNHLVPPLPPLLVRIIHAANKAPGDSTDRGGQGAVLADLGQWALVQIPSRGVLAPADEHAYKAIHDIAMRHLPYREARRAFRTALSSVEPVERRHDIESAQNWLRSVSDDAYYYAGLACGIILADLSGGR